MTKFIKFSSQLSSGDASDSICPKGWGMARYDGDGSYEKLVASNYGYNKSNKVLSLSYYFYKKYINADELAKNIPLSFVRSGWYYNERQQYGRYYTTRASKGINGNNLEMYNTYIFVQNNIARGTGQSVRCVAK